MECVTHFGSTGCLVAKSLSVFGKSAQEDNEPASSGFIPLSSL
jgi:hypothetical protein